MINSTTESWQESARLPFYYAENFQKNYIKIKEVEIEVEIGS